MTALKAKLIQRMLNNPDFSMFISIQKLFTIFVCSLNLRSISLKYKELWQKLHLKVTRFLHVEHSRW